MVRDFYFWAIWAAGPVDKKKLGADYEQLLRAFFSWFWGQKFLDFFFGIKPGFFRAAEILKSECTTKRYPIAGVVI